MTEATRTQPTSAAVPAPPGAAPDSTRTKAPSGAGPAARVTTEMDRINLVQALRDVEVANGRVIDLTARLIECVQERDLVQVELDAARTVLVEHAARAAADDAALRAQSEALARERAELQAVRASRTWRATSLAFRLGRKATGG